MENRDKIGVSFVVKSIIIWLIIFGVVGGIVALIVGSQNKQVGNNTPIPAAQPTQHISSQLLSLTGAGSKSTQKFTVGGSEWELAWNYDCKNFGSKGNFQIYIYNGDGSLSSIGLVNQIGDSGSDTEYYHRGGTYYLQINSECSWNVTTKG